jgi:GNAT superfamily N-acetyltransferase
MIRPLGEADFESILQVVNDGARAYRGVIPADRLGDPYMSAAELRAELAAGVRFWGYEDDGGVAGVMGIQEVGGAGGAPGATLIRHAYVRTARQGQGIGSGLLARLRTLTDRPVLMGTWADAAWAIRFYQRHGFRVVPPQERRRLLRTYWTVPERQVETSVVLADEACFAAGVAAAADPEA